MSDKIDMSLDDIIKQNRGQFRVSRGRQGGSARGRGGRGPGTSGRGFSATRGFAGQGASGGIGVMRIRGRGGRARTVSYSRPKVLPDKGQHMLDEGVTSKNRTAAGINAPTKLLVSNLYYGVSDADIKELFSEFGPLRKAAVRYDRSGRSLETADVVFERRTDAIRAMKKHNGVQLDGHPMKIQIANFSILNPSSRPGSGGTSHAAGERDQGRGSGRGGRNRIGATRKVPTAEELDAELDAYVNKII